MLWSDIGHHFLSLITLFFLEVVLGVDNLIFLSIASSRLPRELQNKARILGLLFALVTRLGLLITVSWLAGLTRPIFHVAQFNVSGRDLLLTLGGIFLLYKGTQEVHNEFSNYETQLARAKVQTKLFWVVCQIAALDIIFSLDSVITAIGMTQNFAIMATAISLAVLVMIFASKKLCHFIDDNPSIKMLAISFILMVGMVLLADGLHYHIPRGYIYFSITFSLFVETLNISLRNKNSNRENEKRQ